ncbi:MAG: hypothetical protein ACI8W7_002760, partial [Gammaproteobacteria bacterium]
MNSGDTLPNSILGDPHLVRSELGKVSPEHYCVGLMARTGGRTAADDHDPAKDLTAAMHDAI